MSEATQELDATDALNPGALLDELIRRLNLKNDAALAKALEVAPPVISKLRNGRLPVGATILITMHEVTGMTVAKLRSLMGDRRAKFRGSFGAEVTGE
jgi:plasmid maintenance system antidote protein VapI